MRAARWMALLVGAAVSITAEELPGRRNAIIFVADGLRPGSVNPHDTPALYRVTIPAFGRPTIACISTKRV